MSRFDRWKVIVAAVVVGTGVTVFAGEGEPGSSADKQARRAEMLAKYDANKDGRLDDAERQKLRSERAARRFKKLDTDGNGALSLAEFEAGMGKGRGFGKHHGRK